jgi:hypothetical protein
MRKQKYANLLNIVTGKLHTNIFHERDEIHESDVCEQAVALPSDHDSDEHAEYLSISRSRASRRASNVSE